MTFLMNYFFNNQKKRKQIELINSSICLKL